MTSARKAVRDARYLVRTAAAVLRSLARRYCERFTTSHTERPALVFATARPDVLIITDRREA